MSASKQKRIRNELRNEGPDKKLMAQQEAEQKNKKFKRNAIIAVVLVVVLVAGALFVNSNYLYNQLGAVKIGDETFSAAEFNYYYQNVFNSFVEENSTYFSMLVDMNTPLDEQQCMIVQDEGTTWADYFTDQAIASMAQVTALYEEAEANGYELDEATMAAIDSAIESYATAAKTAGASDVDAYLALQFGKGMNEELFRETSIRYLTAVNYGQTVLEGFTFTEEELDEHYETIADNYDRISYHVYFVSTENSDFDDLADDAKKTAAHDRAAAIANATTGEEFSNNLYETLSDEDKELYEGEEYTLTNNYIDGFFSSYSEWLLAKERLPGDSTVIDSDVGSYALLFLERDHNQYKMANVRHILAKAEANEEGEYTEEALAAAEAKLNILLGMYNGDPTEENFATIALNNSEDEGSASVGGLYENVYKGQMVEGFEEFCFAEGRQPGDVGIVYGENDNYAGYHLMYYVGEGPVFADYLADSDLRTAAYNEHITSAAAKYPTEKLAGLKFASVNVSVATA